MNRRLLCTCVTGISLMLCSTTALSDSWPDRLERPSMQTPLAGTKTFTDGHAVDGESVLVGADGVIVRVDTANNVEQSQVPVDLLLTGVDFVDNTVGWAVGHDGAVLHTLDGGKSWQKQIDGRDVGRIILDWTEARIAELEAAIAENPDDEDLATQLDDALFKQGDIEAGMEFGPSLPLMNVWFRDESTGIVVGAFGIALMTRDGGETWSFLSGIKNPYSFHLNAVTGLPDGTLLVAGENGLLFRSFNDGDTWTSRELGQDSIYNFLAMPNGDVLAMGFGGSLYRSTDSGQNWNALDTGTQSTFFGGTSLSEGGVLLARQGGLLYSRDLENFRFWKSRGRAIWMDVVETQPGQLTLGGQAGVTTMTLDSLKGALE